jgi:hypothetical protein
MRSYCFNNSAYVLEENNTDFFVHRYFHLISSNSVQSNSTEASQTKLRYGLDKRKRGMCNFIRVSLVNVCTEVILRTYTVVELGN